MTIEKIINKVSIFKDINDAQTELAVIVSKLNKPFIVSFVNAHAINLCHSDSKFLEAILTSDLVLRDGSGMKLLYKLSGLDAGENLNGTDLIPALMQQFKNKKFMFLGSSDKVSKLAKQKMTELGNDICLVENGFHDVEFYVEKIRNNEVDIIVLGMGMPKQELVSLLIREKIEKEVLIINGGAILDFISGVIARAPRGIRMLGLEWVYRLVNEPKRLWRRYIVGNFLFIVRIVKYAVFK